MITNRGSTQLGRVVPGNVCVFSIHHHACKLSVAAQKRKKQAATARVMRRSRVEEIILIIEKMRLMRTDLVTKSKSSKRYMKYCTSYECTYHMMLVNMNPLILPAMRIGS